MLKCNELYHLTTGSEERPFWKDRANDAQPDIQCAMGCGAQPSDPGPQPDSGLPQETLTAAISTTPTSMKDELAAAQEICSRAKTAVVEMFSHARMGRSLELEQVARWSTTFLLRSHATPMPLSASHALKASTITPICTRSPCVP